MNARIALASMLLTAGLMTISADSSAKEIREPHAHVVVDIPDSWDAFVEGDYAVAAPTDRSFHLRLLGLDDTWDDEKSVERGSLRHVERYFRDWSVETHARRVDFNNYRGWEVWGSGTLKSGERGKFFVFSLYDKKRPSKGVVALGTGSAAGFDMHHHGIHEAIKTLRTY